MRLDISDQKKFNEAVRKDWFKTATYVRLYNLPGVTAVPDLPAATYVRLYNLPGVTAVPDLPAATDVRLYNLPGVTAVPRIHPRGQLYRNGRVWR